MAVGKITQNNILMATSTQQMVNLLNTFDRFYDIYEFE